MRVVGDIARLNAKRHAGKTAVVYENKSITFFELNEQANRFANALTDLGYGKGDKVAILSNNCIEYLAIYYGLVKCGIVVVPINYRYSNEEHIAVLNYCDAKVLIFNVNYNSAVQDIKPFLTNIERFIFFNGEPKGQADISYRDLLLSNSSFEPDISVGENDDLAIIFTGGTTGVPKGVVHSHRSILDITKNTIMEKRIETAHIALVTLPFFHAGGLWLLAKTHLFMGATIVLMEKFDVTKMFELIEQERITTFLGVPTQYEMLLENGNINKNKLNSLERLWYGSAPMPFELLKRCFSFFPNAQFFQAYGQTESGLALVLSPEDHEKRPQATGREMVDTEIRLVDDSGNDVLPGQPGEIVIKKDYAMKEYYKNPEATNSVFKNGWLYSGDLAVTEKGGYYTLIGRTDDMIISGGENIYLKEVEEVLYSHPGVLEVAVIGAPDKKWGQIPCAFIVIRDEYTLTEEDFAKYCLEKLAKYKNPKHFIFMEKLPKTQIGKIQKNVLKEYLPG